MKAPRFPFVATLLCAGLAAAGPAGLAGTWVGTSTCVDRQRAPACNDERIGFVFSDPSARGALHLDAQKLVGGAYDTMFEIDLVPGAAAGEWVHDFETRRGDKARWTFRVGADGALAGRLLERPSGAAIREVQARRGA